MCVPTLPDHAGAENSRNSNFFSQRNGFHVVMEVLFGCDFSYKVGSKLFTEVDGRRQRRETYFNNTHHAEALGHAHPGGLLF